MAKPKSPTGGKRQKASIVDSTSAVSGQPAAAETLQTETMQAETRPDTRKLGVVVKADRPNLVPINLEDEIRRRAYELAQERGFESGHETEDWVNAEREVLQRYHQQSA
jgi:hypothetical protein